MDISQARRRYVFQQPPRLAPATRDQIKAMDLKPLEPYIHYLRNYRAYRELGVGIQGIILYGRAGTGKTLVARWIATESGARIIVANDFPLESESWRPQDIKELFELAREYVEIEDKPVLILWDEFESVFGYDKEGDGRRAQLISALSMELDGLAGRNPGIVMAAMTTNLSSIDSRLLRPGRLGNVFSLREPSAQGKLEILEYYLGKKPRAEIDPGVLRYLVDKLSTPAEIEEFVEKAYLRELHRNFQDPSRAIITTRSLIETILEQPEDLYPHPERRWEISVHEAGHGILGRFLGIPVQLILVYGNRGETISKYDGSIPYRDFVSGKISQSYGGILAEQMVFGRIQSDISYELRDASRLAWKLITQMGGSRRYRDINFGGFGTSSSLWELGERVSYLGLGSDQLRSQLEQEVIELLETQRIKAEQILSQIGRSGIELIAQELMREGFMTQARLDELLNAHQDQANAKSQMPAKDPHKFRDQER